MSADPLSPPAPAPGRKRKPPVRHARRTLSPAEQAARACRALRDAECAADTLAATVMACSAADELDGRARDVRRAEQGLAGMCGWDWDCDREDGSER